MNDMHEHYTLRQVAEALHLDLRRIRGWADTGRIKIAKNGRQSLRHVPAAELERLNREGFYVDWTAADKLTSGQIGQVGPETGQNAYGDGMKAEDVKKSESYQRIVRVREQLADNRRALKDARQRARFYKPDDADELKRIEAAHDALVRVKAQARIGDASEAEVQRAEADLAAVTADVRKVKREAAEERSILEAQRKLLEAKAAEATADLEVDTAEVMRPAAARWLDALAAFLEANDALHAVEVELSDLSIPPVVTAARDVTLTLANSREHVLPMLRRSRAWKVYYAEELSKHRALSTRTELLKREHEKAAEAAARLAERQTKAQASLTAKQAGQRRGGRRALNFLSRAAR